MKESKMQFKNKNLSMISILILVQSFQVSGIAAVEESPVEIIKNRNKTVEEIIGNKDEVKGETKERLKDIINSFMDFNELSRLALGKYWKERTKQEKRDFANVFQQLIRNSSVKKLEIYRADRMVYEEPEINGSKAKVTTIAYKKRKQFEITYKMHKVDNEWKTYDMEIDGVSTARSYRDSFYKQIAKTSYKEMYDKLVKRLENQK
ncbi:ABC transporter substrate-binding protein [candidate division KSB1 bacterium]|nr:ABC transporter substrate-binding protein [candidate division KSB1 bacterium]